MEEKEFLGISYLSIRLWNRLGQGKYWRKFSSIASLLSGFRIELSLSFTVTVGIFYIFYHTSAKSRQGKGEILCFNGPEPQLCLNFKPENSFSHP